MNELARRQSMKAARAGASAAATLDTDPHSAASRACHAAFHGMTAVGACRGLSFKLPSQEKELVVPGLRGNPLTVGVPAMRAEPVFGREGVWHDLLKRLGCATRTLLHFVVEKHVVQVLEKQSS